MRNARLRRSQGACSLALLIACLVGSPARGADTLVFRNVDVFDGSKMQRGVSVVVRKGVIESVGKEAKAPAGAEIIDGAGLTLLPGLIDCHSHTFAEAMLQQALVFGVTTELDMFTDFHLAASFRQQQRAGRARNRADLYSAGTLVTAKGGHGTQFGLTIPTIAGPEEAVKFVDARLEEGSDYIKIVYEDGKPFGIKFTPISKETLAAVVVAAHQRHKLAVVHVSARERARDALAADVDGLVHLFVDQPIDDALVRLAVDKKAFVVPTLTVLQSAGGTPSGQVLLEDAALAPFLTATDAQGLKGSFPRNATASADYRVPRDAVRKLKAAGVPILAGTDAPNPGTAHGASMHRELELLVDAGLTPAEALAAATAVPAQHFRLADRGRIAPGLRADLCLVKGDPTRDIRATRAIVGVWKEGQRLDRNAYRAGVARQKGQVARQHSEAPPEGLADGLVSDFEGPEGSAPKAAFGFGWQESTDKYVGGSSTVKYALAKGGANGSKGSLRITGTIANKSQPRWAGVLFCPGKAMMAPANLSSRKAMLFWAKGDGKKYSVMLFTESSGFRPIAKEFSAGSEWKQYRFAFKEFNGSDGKDIMAVFFGGGPEVGAFELRLDDVRFEGEKESAGPQSRDLEQAARAFVELLGKGEFERATADFDATMRKVMLPDKLKKAWQKVLDDAGPFKKQTGSRRDKSGKYDVLYVTCEMGKSKVDVRVVFDKDSKIAGLSFGPARKPRPSGVEEIWEGKLKAGAIEIRLVFHFFKQKDGSYAGTMDSPDQGAKDLDLDEVSIKDDAVRIELKSAGLVFQGKRGKEGQEISGDFKQAGRSFPLTLKKVTKVSESRRPQTPHKPYPYDEIDVAYESKAPGIKLAGTLTVPRSTGPFPAVLLIQGSGAHDRDETIFGHKPFLVLADYLTRRGIAVLRVDKRGVGGSSGSTREGTSAAFADDVLAGVEFLKNRPEVKPSQIGLIGHSEGGAIAPLAASRSRDVAFIVLLAGPGLPGEQTLYIQGAALLKVAGASAEELARQKQMQERIFSVLRQEKDNAAAEKKIRAAIAELTSGGGKGGDKAIAEALPLVEGQVQMVTSPWFRYFLDYDPRPALRKVTCPVLALNGEKDLQVDAPLQLKAIETALKEAGNHDVTARELPNLNHLFQTCKTGSVSEYGAIEETIAPSVLETIADWILKRTAGPRKP
jgi:imidazolonepropionase-like amidohydrolase/pimeloyl-ACP methyl ester carboxylesterase